MIFFLRIAMNIILFGLIISVFIGEGIYSNCEETNQIESFCGSYCFKSILKIVDHTNCISQEVNNWNNNNNQRLNIFDKIDNLEVKLQSNLERKQNQIDRIVEQISQTYKKLETIEKHLETSDSLEEKLSEELEDQYELIETVFNTTFNGITEKFNSLEKQLKEKMDRSFLSVSKYTEPPKSSLFNQIGGKYYYIEHDKRVNWFVAAETCLTLGGHLVSFQNEEEFNAVKKHLNSAFDYWINLNDLGTKGEFISIVTGLKPKYTNWHLGEPNNNNSDEHCVNLWYTKYEHLMNDGVCSDKIGFICELSM